MAPVLQDRFLVVVDRTKRDPATLAGSMVAAWGEGGLVVRWMAKESKAGKIILRPENPSYPNFLITSADHILGRVIFWWGTQR
jgi:SOS-response transcriptional repressor LexA